MKALSIVVYQVGGNSWLFKVVTELLLSNCTRYTRENRGKMSSPASPWVSLACFVQSIMHFNRSLCLVPPITRTTNLWDARDLCSRKISDIHLRRLQTRGQYLLHELLFQATQPIETGSTMLITTIGKTCLSLLDIELSRFFKMTTKYTFPLQYLSTYHTFQRALRYHQSWARQAAVDSLGLFLLDTLDMLLAIFSVSLTYEHACWRILAFYPASVIVGKALFQDWYVTSEDQNFRWLASLIWQLHFSRKWRSGPDKPILKFACGAYRPLQHVVAFTLPPSCVQ